MSPELWVGILVLIGILCLFYMSFRIGKFGAFQRKVYDIMITLENANGLDPRTPIQIAGVEVGKIRTIKLDGYKAAVALSIHQNIKLPADSQAAVKTQGVLGDKYIEIIPGKEEKYLAAGDHINNVIKPPDFNEIFTQVGSAAKSFGTTMDQFRDVFGEKDKDNLKKSIANIEAASGEFKDLVKANKGGITRVVSNMESISNDIKAGKGTIGKLAVDDTLYHDAKEVVTSLKTISSNIEQGKGSLGKLTQDEGLYNEAKEAISNIKELTDGIKKGEGTLGKLAKDESLYNETEKAVKKVQKGAEGIQEMTPVTILGTIFGAFF